MRQNKTIFSIMNRSAEHRLGSLKIGSHQAGTVPGAPSALERGITAKLRTAARCVLMFVAIFSLTLAAQAGIKVGDQFPDLAACSLDGNLPDRSKDAVILVDFWASWCGPCKQSFATMNELQKTYGPRGLRIIAVNVDEQRSGMENFLKDHPVSFTVVRDGKQVLVEKVDIGTMPSSFLLDKTGKVVFMHSGFHGGETKKQYEHEIESLLGPDQK